MRAISAARVFLLALATLWAVSAAADVAVPPLSGRVVDLTGTLSDGDVASLTQKLRDLEARKGSQVAVLLVPTTQPETIEQYSIRVAEAWKIGRKKIDDGALLVVAKNDHKLRIEVGYGLEGALTDVTARRIIDEVITPKFRQGDFAGGISDGVTRIIGVIDGEPLPPPAPEASHGRDTGALNGIGPFAIVAFLGFAAVLRRVLGRLVGSVATGGIAGLLAWLFVGSIAASALVGAIAFVFALIFDMFSQFGPSTGYRGGGGFAGGSYSGGGWSGGSGSGGGFSGGGGSFGGGGASGSW